MYQERTTESGNKIYALSLVISVLAIAYALHKKKGILAILGYSILGGWLGWGLGTLIIKPTKPEIQ